MIPVKLTMENFLSHKKSEIDFSEFNSALLIGNTEGDYTKSNGSGKSAIFEGILWCLFNKSRVSMMDDVVKWGETTCKISLEFSHSNLLYKVIRVRNRANSSSNVELKVAGEDGVWIDISGSTSGDTNEKIENTIKLDYKTFINSVYFRQNDISEFAESEASRKKEILKSIIDISRWDDYERTSKSKLKDLVSEAKILQSSLEALSLTLKDLSSSKEELSLLEKEISSLKENKINLNNSILFLKEKYDNIKKSLDTSTYDNIIIEIENLKKDGKNKTAERVSILETLSSVEDSLSKENDLLKSLINKEKKLVLVPDNILSELSSQITYHKSNYISGKKEIDIISCHLESHDKTKCPTCEMQMDEKTFDKFLSAQREKLDKLKIDVNNHKIEIDSLNSQINHWNKIISENLILEKEISKKSSVEYKISMLNDQLTQCNLSIEKIDKEILIIKNSLNQNKILLESIKNKDFQDLKNEIKSLESEAITVEESIYDREKKSGMLQERINNLNSKISDFNSKKSLLNEKNKKISILEKLTKMFGKTGIQTVLLDSIIEDLEKTSNNILKSICNEPSTIVLETQRLGSDGISIVETLDLKVLKDGNLYNFKSLSGGEKFRISLALRIGMSDLSSRYGGSCLEFLMLDEVNSPLDRYGVETLFVNVIKSLENRYKILTITHDESLKEKFDNVINVTKINGESEVEFLVR